MKNPTRKELIQLLNFIRDHNKKLNSDLTSTQMVNDQGTVHLFTINDTIKSRDDTMKCAQSIMNSK